MKAKFLKRLNVILASLIAMLGVGCKSHKVVTIQEDEPPIPSKEDVMQRDEIRCLYGPAPMLFNNDTLQKEGRKDVQKEEPKPVEEQETIMVKYGMPPSLMKE